MTARDVAEALDGVDTPRTVGALTAAVDTIGAADGPHEILAALAGHGGTGLPVVNNDGSALIGWITYEDVLARMHPDIDNPSDSAG